ncbi:MAG: outer membrane protein assembly factor BamD [Caulobacteraceae bacterium]
MSRNSYGRASIAIALTLTVALGAGLGGCAMFKKKKPTLAYQERPVALLYNAGATRLDHHKWSEAVEYFKEVERQHPYSEWARRSILMSAYAHYMANDYTDAVSDADQFISLYPGNASTPYAYYLKATCYFEQIVDVGRDQAMTRDAGAALREVAKRYPNSEYAEDARLKIDMVQDQLAGKEMTVGRYYLRDGNTIGAIGRFRTVVDQYQTTSHTPEALYRLVEAYLTLGLVQEAKRDAAVLGYNYPGSPWYADAYKLMMGRGVRLEGAPNPSGARGPHFPLFGHHDKNAVPPPPAETTDASVADSDTPAKAPPAKEGGLVHGVLGL